MNITDIIALAKQGYKPSDIKELMALAEPEQPIIPPVPEAEKAPEPEQPESVPKEAETVPKESTQPAPAESTEHVKELEKKIEALQEEHRRRDVSGKEEDPQLQVNDMVAGFM